MERPSQQTIDDWIAGNLPGDAAAEVEAYFEENPDDLPPMHPMTGLLKEAATSAPEDPSVTALIETLKARSMSELSDLPGGGCLDILAATDREGILGKLGQYEVIEVLATTGMGIVFKAFDPELKRTVALKVLSPALAGNGEARERFLREAKAMAKLEHANIVPIFGIHNDEVPWFAMRYIEGGSLQDALDKEAAGLRTPEFLESLASQMGAALEVAHGAGMIHRDFKPANILLDSESDRMWLTDFGIARVSEDPGLTYGDGVPGTPRYMSPEQATGRQVDARTDLFSLGSVMYHVATGRPPFEGSNSTAILHKVSEERPTHVTRLNPGLPVWLADLIDGLLSKDPSRRPSILPALKAREVTSRGGWKMGWIVAMAAVILVGGLVMFFNREDPAPASVAPPSPNQVTVEETGEVFDDLARAIAAAPEKATLLLKGTFELSETVYGKVGHDLTMKAVTSEERPEIVIKHREWYGLVLRGNVKISGVDFFRPEGLRACSILAITDGGNVEVNDCRFRSPIEIPGAFVYGIEATSPGLVRVVDSSFHGPRFYSLHLKGKDGSRGEKELKVEIKRCYLEGSTGVFAELGQSPPLLEMEIEKVIMHGKRFLRFGERGVLAQADLSVQDSILDCRNEVILIEGAKMPELLEGLRWTGERNFFGSRGYLFRLSKPVMSLNDLDSIQEVFPKYEEGESIRRDLFDAAGNLPPNLESRAIEVFQRLR